MVSGHIPFRDATSGKAAGQTFGYSKCFSYSAIFSR